MANTKHNGWGGARKGSGRKPTYSKLYAFRAPQEMAAYLDRKRNKSKFIQDCIQRAIDESAAQLGHLGTAVPASRVKDLTIPMVEQRIVAGVPIPLDSAATAPSVDLLGALCPHPDDAYLMRVNGESMIDAGIHSGDILVVDGSQREPTEADIAICELNGEYTVKRVRRQGDHGLLIPANPQFSTIEISPTDDFSVWGVVTYVIHKA